MKSVASRELRNHTAGVLKEVADGRSVAITVHGNVVAELVPPRDQRPRVIPRHELATLLEGLAPDPELRDLLDEIAGETTDDLDEP